MIAHMEACYPGVAEEAECTEETLLQYEREGLADQSCDEIDRAGKADLFAFGGCPAGQHVCAWLFCCDDYVLRWFPHSEGDWEILDVVRSFQDAAPADVFAELDAASEQELRGGVGVTFLQEVAEYPGQRPVEMAVEISQILVDVDYDTFSLVLPADEWGIRLEHHLGGEVKVYRRDEGGRVVRQLERMVLSPVPCDYESTLTNNDMTKVEVIEYGPQQAKVFWRVMHSDNNSTETDVGSVEFRAWGEDATLVVFHSAHRLNAPGGIHIPNALLQPALLGTFLDFARGYRSYVHSQTSW